MTGPYPPPTPGPVRRNYQPAPAGVWLCERRHANPTAGATGDDPVPPPGALPPRRPGEGVAPVDPAAARRARARSNARATATVRLQRILRETR